MNDNDEILIQRCVDNELSTDERRALLNRLDDLPEGWKSLACSYIEDQLFEDAVATPTSEAVEPLPTVAKPAAKPTHWFHHPVTSLVLSICIAFTLGLLIRGEWPGSVTGGTDIAAAGPVGDASPETPSGTSNAARPDNDIKVHLVGDGMKSQSLPLYVSDQVVANAEREWQQINEFMRSTTRQRPDRIRYIVVTIEGRKLIIPVVPARTQP
jgi:hypothetical protein